VRRFFLLAPLAVGCLSKSTRPDAGFAIAAPPSFVSSAPPPTTAPTPKKVAPIDPAFGPRPPRRLAAGKDFSCAVTDAGQLKCWGNNAHGQLGDGTDVLKDGPVKVAALDEVIEIAAGSHACALRKDGSVWCWGGVLPGDGGIQPVMRVEGIDRARQISVGDESSCAVSEGDRVRCWRVAQPATPLSLEDVSEVSVGAAASCARTSTGRVWCWSGDAAPKEVDGITEAVAIEVANEACTRDKSGMVQCWTGSDAPARKAELPAVDALRVGADWGCVIAKGQVVCWGGGPKNPEQGSQGDIVKLDGVVAPTELAAGSNHLCARIESGEVLCWGANDEGQLGVSPGTSYASPVDVPGATNVRAITAGNSHACAVFADGRAQCWGASELGQLGSDISPSVIDSIRGATAVAAGADRSCAVYGGGAVACWGTASSGELGAGPPPPPKRVPTPARAKQAAIRDAAEFGMIGLLGSGEVGGGIVGIGSGFTGDGESPSWRSASTKGFVLRVTGVAAARDVALGSSASCALTGGGVMCWGYSGLNEDLAERGCEWSDPDNQEICKKLKVPRLVNGTRGATALSGAGENFCVVQQDGKIGCWSAERLLDGTGVVTVENLQKPAVLRAGQSEETCAIDAAGDLWCWYALSLPEKSDLVTDPVADIAVGSLHRCVVLKSGAVKCWGTGEQGQLGTGRRVSEEKPTTVLGINDATSVVVGNNFSCALRRTGSVRCWGSGSRQMGLDRDPVTFDGTPRLVTGIRP
jgi:alpha-tubulin suppressor-like RCC1 family protein